MVTVTEGLELVDALRLSLPEVRTTGLSFLDSATRGFAAGQVWIVIGTPGQGRSTMACQLAWAVSTHGLATSLVSRKERVELMSARVASMVAKVPLSHLWAGPLSSIDREKLRLMAPLLETATLSVVGPEEITIADADAPGRVTPEALVVDDAQLAGGMFPSRVAGLARAGVLVVLTLPRHRLISDNGLDPAWADVADVVLEINRPDLIDRSSLRPGEAELHLLRNRWGPTRSDVVAFQGHYSRFVDLNAG